MKPDNESAKSVVSKAAFINDMTADIIKDMTGTNLHDVSVMYASALLSTMYIESMVRNESDRAYMEAIRVEARRTIDEMKTRDRKKNERN